MEEGARRARQPRGDLGGGCSDRAARSSSQRRCCRCNGVMKCFEMFMCPEGKSLLMLSPRRSRKMPQR